MGVHYLTAELWRRHVPHAFNADVYFRRPIFWDESITVGVLQHVGIWRGLALLKVGEVNKVGTEIALHDLLPA